MREAAARHGTALLLGHQGTCWMARVPKSASLKTFSRKPPSLAERTTILHEIHTLDDRSVAILAAVHLESSLEAAILTKMIPLPENEVNEIFSGDAAPLSTFSAKIRMAFAMGILGPQTRKDLNIIKNIRNAFAHAQRPVKFDTPEIATACAQIQFLGLVSRPEGPDYPDGSDWPPAGSRRQYIEATGFIAASFVILARECGVPDILFQTDDLARLIAK
jgi:hypothetical protein